MIFFVFQKIWVFGYSWSTLLWYRCYYPHRSRDALSPVCGIFKASALWADAFYKSKCPYVCVFVCLSVCLFTFEVPFNGLFAPTSRSRMSKNFRDSESLGKSNGKKWSHIWNFFVWKRSKIAAQKKVCFVADFALQNMVETTLPDGLETSGGRVYR